MKEIVSKILEGLVYKRERVMEMTVQELLDGIGKRNIKVTTKDGVEGLQIFDLNVTQKKFVEKNTSLIKDMKGEILVYLKQEEADKAKVRAEAEVKRDQEIDSKIQSGEAKLSLVWYGMVTTILM
jgi:hypothetical protein